ncbi:MAG: hypothetical protein N2234_10235 [Planctomycetota bacterium]|nr:hypothetical protein [Planctomycetota bacterium]
MSIPLYLFLFSLFLSSAQVHPSFVSIFHLLLLTIIIPLVARIFRKMLSFSLFFHLILYALPAVALSSQIASIWWSPLISYASLFSTAAAVWVVSNKVSSKFTSYFWAVLTGFFSLPILLGEISKPFLDKEYIHFISPLGYTIAPFSGNYSIAIFAALLIWIPTLFLYFIRKEPVCAVKSATDS